MTHYEIVPNDRAVYQSGTAKTYQCPFCLRPVFSQYDSDELPLIVCQTGFGQEERDGVRYATRGQGDHILTWAAVAQK